MKRLNVYRRRILVGTLIALFAWDVVTIQAQDGRPVADAGSSRYAGPEPVVLDGTGSYDPDSSGPLTYEWQQIGGPSVVITGADTAAPTVSGLAQTNEIQECEFELVVSDGELSSLPETVKVMIVPDFGASALRLQNPPFNLDKPTVIYFGGGNCVTGRTNWDSTQWAVWEEKANIIIFPNYGPDPGGDMRTYYRYGDMIIVYLSSVAPDYKQPIQSIGYSTGGQPAIDVGIHLNLTYEDARYAVNRVTLLDVGVDICRNYSASIITFFASSVDGEQCWIDRYYGLIVSGTRHTYYIWPDELVVSLGLGHGGVQNWYRDSLTGNDMNNFNHGLVAGAYWSVIGPGKNLQLAPTDAYYFRWDGNNQSGGMSIFDEARHPGRLPEPVTLGAWITLDDTSGEVDGAVLTCHESENAVGYELLFGSDPYRIMDFRVISDTPLPPMDAVRDLPPEETWWTVRVRDAFGSTIYADPVRLNLTNLPVLSVTNARTGKRYGLISHAILDAEPDDLILLDPATYNENIELGAKTLTVSSLDSNDPNIVAATVIRGRDSTPTVTFSGPESAGCLLTGLTIQSDSVGVSCRDVAPTIQNCVIECPDGIAIEFWYGCSPSLIDCTIVGQIREGGDLGLIAYWKLDETEGNVARESISGSDDVVMGDPLWQPTGGKVDGALELDGVDDCVISSSGPIPAQEPFSLFAWIKGGAPGQVIISQPTRANWLMVDAEGKLMTELGMFARIGPLRSEAMIIDGQWQRVGLVWDGSNRTLYVDGVVVAEDTLSSIQLSTRGLYIGAGKDFAPGSFFSGLIDDVRIYNRIVSP